MTVTSSKVPDRFTPDGADVTYLIEIPTPISKARYRRAVTASGARIWTKSVLIASAREAIQEAAPENAETLLAICSGYESTEDGPAIGADSDEAAQAELRKWQELNLGAMKAWGELSRILQGAGGDFAARVADNEFWWEVAPLMSARTFLLGTETVKLKRGADGLIPDATLVAAIPEDHIAAIGWRAMALFSPSSTQAKNSASPRPSPSGPASSNAASAPLTEANGTSLASATSATQA